MLVCRNPPTQDEEGAAGCEASKQAQQAGAGGPQHFPCPQRPGETRNPPADRDEAGQVSRSVWTQISAPSTPHLRPPPSHHAPLHVCLFNHSFFSTFCLFFLFYDIHLLLMWLACNEPTSNVHQTSVIETSTGLFIYCNSNSGCPVQILGVSGGFPTSTILLLTVHPWFKVTPPGQQTFSPWKEIVNSVLFICCHVCLSGSCTIGPVRSGFTLHTAQHMFISCGPSPKQVRVAAMSKHLFILQFFLAPKV